MSGDIRNIILNNLFTVFLLISIPAGAQIDFSYQSSYKWLKGSDAATLPNTWKNPGFDDSGWSSGNAPFRYGDGTGGTELIDMKDLYSTRRNAPATPLYNSFAPDYHESGIGEVYSINSQPGLIPDGSLLAFPNPTTGYLTLHYLSENEIEVIILQVFDIKGKLVYTTAKSNPGSIDLTSLKLPAGIYFLKTAESAFKSSTRIVLLKQ